MVDLDNRLFNLKILQNILNIKVNSDYISIKLRITLGLSFSEQNGSKIITNDMNIEKHLV